MDLYSILKNEDQRSVVDHLVSEQEQIVEQVSAFLARLADVCDDLHVNKYWGTNLISKNNGTAVEIRSPFGVAHFGLRIVIVDEKVEGDLSLRKEDVDDVGQPSLPLVASIRVTRHGIYLSKDQAHPIAAKTHLSGEDKSAYQIMSAILYLLGTA